MEKIRKKIFEEYKNFIIFAKWLSILKPLCKNQSYYKLPKVSLIAYQPVHSLSGLIDFYIIGYDLYLKIFHTSLGILLDLRIGARRE